MSDIVLLIASTFVSGCLAYLISEINQIQKNLQRLNITVAVLESKLPKRKDDPY